MFKLLPRDKQLQYITNSYLVNLQYILLDRIQLHPYMELIKVKLE